MRLWVRRSISKGSRALPPPGCSIQPARLVLCWLMFELFRKVSVWSVAGLAAAQLALADPAPPALPACEAAGAQEAGVLADKLFGKGEYQHAGVCYQAAGDMVHANLAFLKAVGPQSEDTARALKTQRDTAKSLFDSVGHAFRGSH